MAYPPTADTMSQIAALCAERPHTRRELAEALGRANGVGLWSLAERMVADGRLTRTVAAVNTGQLAYSYSVNKGEDNADD